MKNKYLFAITALATTAAITIPVAQADAATFKDVKAGSEMAVAIDALSKQGIISGYQDGTFQPGKAITRAQAAKILALSLKLDTDVYIEKTFDDVPETHANAPYIYALANAGIINPNATHFNPNAKVTRTQLAKMLAEGFNLQAGEAPPFKDVKSAEAKKYVGSLYAYGITKGNTETTFGSSNDVTRGQMALFIYRAINSTADARATFTNELFNEKYVFGALNDHYSDGSIDLIYENRYGTMKWLEVNALKPGTSYFYIGGHDGESANEYTTPIRYYRADVVLENGKLKLTTTELDSPLVEPAYYFIGEHIADVTLTNVDGSAVDESLYKLEESAEGRELYFFGNPAEYLLEETYKDGTKRTTALKYEVIEPRSQVITGQYAQQQHVLTKEYLKNQQYVENITSIEMKPFVSGWDIEIPQAFTAELKGEEIHLSIFGEGSNVIQYQTSDGSESEFTLHVEAFGDGYLMY